MMIIIMVMMLSVRCGNTMFVEQEKAEALRKEEMEKVQNKLVGLTSKDRETVEKVILTCSFTIIRISHDWMCVSGDQGHSGEAAARPHEPSASADGRGCHPQCHQAGATSFSVGSEVTSAWPKWTPVDTIFFVWESSKEYSFASVGGSEVSL